MSQVVGLEDFLLEEELCGLLKYTLEHASSFHVTRITQPETPMRVIDSGYRRSRALFDLGPYRPILLQRVRSYLPWVLEQFGHPFFNPSRLEIGITATNDGEFFRAHNDNTHADYRSRQVTFVYYFYHEPKQFTGRPIADLRFAAWMWALCPRRHFYDRRAETESDYFLPERPCPRDHARDLPFTLVHAQQIYGKRMVPSRPGRRRVNPSGHMIPYFLDQVTRSKRITSMRG